MAVVHEVKDHNKLTKVFCIDVDPVNFLMMVFSVVIVYRTIHLVERAQIDVIDFLPAIAA